MKKIYKNEDRKCDCYECEKLHCPHRVAYRRLPRSVGGLGLCPKLKENGKLK